MRVFIGIALPEAAKAALAASQEMIRGLSSRGNFTPPENFHITLQFIGEVSPEDIDGLKNAVFSAARGARAFECGFGGLGSFPKGNTSIIWYGVEKRQALISLRNNLAKALSREGFKGERGGFEPHITLVRQSPAGGRRLREVSCEGPEAFTVDEITLFESVRRGAELVYRPLYCAKLKA